MSGTITITPGALLEETNAETIYPGKLNNLVESLTAKVDAGAIGVDELADGSIPDSKLSSTLQEQLGIPAGSVTTSKLAANVLTADATGRAKMEDGFVTSAKIAAGAVTTDKIADGAITAIKLSASALSLNMQKVAVNAASTIASAGSWADLTGLTVTITPSSATSRILLLASVNVGCTTASNKQVGVRVMRDATAVCVGTAATDRISVTSVAVQNRPASGEDNFGGSCAICVVDEPATTSAVVYKIQAFVATGSLYFNRSSQDGTNGYRGASTLVALDCKA